MIAEIIVGMIAEMDALGAMNALGEKQMGDKKVQNKKQETKL